MRNAIILAAGLLLASNANALKCQSGKRTLYTDDRNCPSGYSVATSADTGSVSTVGKSKEVERQEQEFLQRREDENRRYSVQLGREQQLEAKAEKNNAFLCQSLANQARSLEAVMRQPNGPQTLDHLKREHRNVRDLQYRNRC